MTPAHEALLDHLMAGTCCHAPSGRYCETGRALWLDYRAECVADGGKETMAMVRHQSPDWAEEIKIRALMLMEKRRGNNANRD
jgi:hypothetical protein